MNFVRSSACLVITALMFFSCYQSKSTDPVSVDESSLAKKSSSAATTRYRDKVFSSVSVTSNVTYAIESLNGKTVNLKADIYYPSNDNTVGRWWITNEHGNNKTKTSSEVVSFCKEMAKYGYVVINIDYREPNKDAEFEDIIFAGADQRNAVRFMRKNASTYRIDVNKCTTFGGSQGGYGSMFAAYDPEIDSLSVSNAGYNGTPNLCGESAGLVDTTKFEYGDPPLFMMHCTDDPKGTFGYAQAVYESALDHGIDAIAWWKSGTCHSFYNCCLSETALRLSGWIFSKFK